MIRKKKDAGFTLIELMIVIAVIGILAVVLVPKIGGIKTSAKSVGIDTNIRTVQAFTEGRASYWAGKTYDAAAITSITSEFTTAFGTGGPDELKNPFTGLTGATAISVSSVGTGNGTIYVVLPAANLLSTGITITGIDNAGAVYKTVTIKP